MASCHELITPIRSLHTRLYSTGSLWTHNGIGIFTYPTGIELEGH